MNDTNYFVHPSAFVEENVEIGEGTKIWHQAQVRKGAKLGKNCVIGKASFIDFEVRLGNNVKVQNLVSIYHGVTVEDDVFIGPHVCFTNDMFPRSVNPDWQLVETYVKKGASIGANSTIVCGKTLGEYCMIGAGSVVTKDVPPFALVYGNPARLCGYVCYCGEVLKRTNEPLPKGTTLKCPKCGEEVQL
ncbi:MAG: acyltransferase [Candidatus Heimdallarchaeaceae archaeon]